MTIVTAAIAATLALAVPDNFDPQANMLINESGLHSVRDTMNHAARLVSQGGPEDLELAGKMIDAVIQCQERRPDDANYGNFLWYKENGVVEDLNGVSFTLGTMIPMMLCHGDRLSGFGARTCTAPCVRMQTGSSWRRPGRWSGACQVGAGRFRPPA